ncbi:hypothetical protein QKU48_gp1264 [Fadolivirus algeromassiliense]|jgi:hypothetical protein|uniref:Uncharacterized protein n=1 Tax=Fadolivirus FV1/VV64 TaxID=3070911 RepID=A0A7D3R1R8_9VIRU|nr:hypothetical protein QKU48_gp1264 [Fadolivirus algeromassiliense]QKF94722.1 hypothetical protein Fadolivirus_1_1264 [Fadolivirus FV1/VV64]
MSKISITRALVELKTLDSRIQKKIDSSVFVSFKGQFHQPADGIKDAAANFQSITDLIERRKKIKSAIVSSNATTKVTICGVEMTMAEAIETKSSIKHKKNLLAVLKSQYGNAVANIESINAKVRRDIETKSNRDNGDKDKQQMTLEEFSKTYVSLHGVELFDPLKVSQKVEQLEQFITQFEQEVDYILSEKNATTFIEV